MSKWAIKANRLLHRTKLDSLWLTLLDAVYQSTLINYILVCVHKHNSFMGFLCSFQNLPSSDIRFPFPLFNRLDSLTNIKTTISFNSMQLLHINVKHSLTTDKAYYSCIFIAKNALTRYHRAWFVKVDHLTIFPITLKCPSIFWHVKCHCTIKISFKFKNSNLPR